MTPKSISTILVPTDFSETAQLAIRHAAFLAQLSKADLLLLHVIEKQSSHELFAHDMIVASDDGHEYSLNDRLNELAENIRKNYRIAVRVKCAAGSVSAGVVEAVEAEKIDLVIMGTHGASGFKEFFIGSNAQNTVKQCPCPVITIQSKTSGVGFRKIVLPVDDWFGSRQKVNFSIRFAKMYAAKVFILGLLDDNETDESTFRVKIHSVEKALLANQVMFETKIIRSNNSANSTLNYANKIDADLISVLTGHESKLNNGFIGSFAKHIVNHSKIPVLNIQPAELGVRDSVSVSGSHGGYH